MSQSKKLKISICGAGGTGKSSLAKKLSEALELVLIPETARLLCSQMGYKRIGDIEDQENFKREVLKRQIEAESIHESFVADRGALDCWILWQRWNICSAMTYETEKLYEAVKNHVQTYTHMIYLPPLFPADEDGFRWTDPDYIKQIDRIVRMSLYELSLWEKVYTVKESRLDRRLLEVENWLQERVRADKR